MQAEVGAANALYVRSKFELDAPAPASAVPVVTP